MHRDAFSRCVVLARSCGSRPARRPSHALVARHSGNRGRGRGTAVDGATGGPGNLPAMNTIAGILVIAWIAIKRAMIVVSKDGFIDWAWGSKRLFKSGIYYRARQETVPLPELSLAARRDPSIDAEIGFVHPKGVWVGNEDVNEMTVFAGKSDLAITLLLYPNDGAN